MKLRNVVLGFWLALLATTVQAEMQVYDVDMQYRTEMFDILERILDSKDNKLGQPLGVVQMLPNGQLLVYAQPPTHGEISKVLDSLHEQSPKVPPKLTLRYWVLTGTLGQEDDAARDLNFLSPVLGELENIHGELGFSIADSLSLTGQSGSGAESHSDPLSVSQLSLSDGSILNAQIELHYRTDEIKQELTASFSILPKEFFVLSDRNATLGGSNTKLFYIVYWPGI